MAGVTFRNVEKIYPDGNHVVHDLNLEIADGEFMVLVGPSGCGKSTALRMVAGLEEITSGDLFIGDVRVNDLAPRARNIAMVFQNYALYPHMTVRENMGFPLEVAKVKKEEIRRRVERAAEILGLTEFLDRRPKALSGGQRQRVAMGRAIVREPAVFLMDEPLSNLDAKLRVQMRASIIRLQDQLETTTIYVTHDQVEAMTMGDRVAVMRKGVLQQVAAPQELYDRPANLFVAGFIGSPSMNLLGAQVERLGPEVWVWLGSQRLRVDPAAVEAHPKLADYDGRTVIMGIRPEHLSAFATAGLPEDQRLSVIVELAESLGAEVNVHFSVDVPAVQTEIARELKESKEEEETGIPVESGRTAMIAKLEGHTRVAVADRVELAVKTANAYFFDADTGLPLR